LKVADGSRGERLSDPILEFLRVQASLCVSLTEVFSGCIPLRVTYPHPHRPGGVGLAPRDLEGVLRHALQRTGRPVSVVISRELLAAPTFPLVLQVRTLLPARRLPVSVARRARRLVGSQVSVIHSDFVLLQRRGSTVDQCGWRRGSKVPAR